MRGRGRGDGEMTDEDIELERTSGSGNKHFKLEEVERSRERMFLNAKNSQHVRDKKQTDLSKLLQKQ